MIIIITIIIIIIPPRKAQFFSTQVMRRPHRNGATTLQDNSIHWN